MKHWTILHLEAYCTINWDYGTKCDKYVYVMDDDHDFDHMKKEPNPQYDPKVKPDKWPKKCTKKLGVDCISCKYLAYTDVDNKLKKRIAETIKKFGREDK